MGRLEKKNKINKIKLVKRERKKRKFVRPASQSIALYPVHTYTAQALNNETKKERKTHI